MSSRQDQIALVEDFLTDLVTQTPIQCRFTAVDMAIASGVPTPECSNALQWYRDVQSGKTAYDAQFVVATYNRGRWSEWFILTWPDMTPLMRDAANVLLYTHEVNSVIREEIAPMLRNIWTQFAPAVTRNRKRNVKQVSLLMGKLDGYFSMLSRWRADMTHVQPMKLRKHNAALLAIVDATITDVDTARAFVASL